MTNTPAVVLVLLLAALALVVAVSRALVIRRYAGRAGLDAAACLGSSGSGQSGGGDGGGG